MANTLSQATKLALTLLFYIREKTEHSRSNRGNLFCNCINDGSWPAVHAFQQECTNRLKVLCSKDKVLNVQVKRSRRTGSGKCNGVECE